MKISIIGLGAMGENHLRVLSEMKKAQIDYIYDKDQKKLNFFSKKYNVKKATNINQIKENSEAVIVATPTSTHFKYIKYFNNKKIFVEKPLVSNYKSSLKVKKIIKSFLQCGFIERFNSITPVIKKIVKSNDIISMNFVRTDRLSSRIKDVDVILDLMIHDIDLAVYFNGKVKKVNAFGYYENKKIAYANAILIHKNNTISRLEASRITQKKIRQIHITTPKAYIDANLLSKEVTINMQSNLVNKNSNLTINSREEKVFINQKEALKSELEAFIKKKIKYKLIPNIDQSIYVLKIAEKIQNEVKKNI